MRVAYFGLNTLPVNLKRHILFAQHFNFKIILRLRFDDMPNGEVDFLITDNCTFYELYRSWLWSHKNKNIRFIVWALELYNISYTSMLKQYLKKKRKVPLTRWVCNLIKNGLLKTFMLRSLAARNNGLLIVSSQPRLEYMNKGCGIKAKTAVLRNKPTSAISQEASIDLVSGIQDKIKRIIHGSSYLFIPGQIYNFLDFDKVCAFAYKNDIKIIAAANIYIDLSHYEKEYPETIYNIGSVSNEAAQALIINSTAGICLYKNDNMNEKLSASSKLFEFMLFNKTIIVSNNFGVENELKSYPKEKIVNVDNLDGFSPQKSKITINKQYLFSAELATFSAF